MTSQDKLIKQGIKYTDAVFDEIAKRLSNGVRSSDTLEDFLSKYNEYTKGEGELNPLVLNGYRDQMLKIILAETNNHKFSRPSQKELTRVVIENRVGDLITDVGVDVQDSVREIVKDGYNQSLSQDEIAEQITHRVGTIKTKRARAIARTEIARTAVISDYMISKERGATHYYVECRNTACPVCKKAWHTKWTPENDSYFNPREKTAGEKGWVGDRTFSMNNVEDLPPKHPNCRCVPYFITDKDIDDDMVVVKEPTTTTTTVEETKPTTEKSNFDHIFTGEPKMSELTDRITGQTMIVYEYENIRLAFDKENPALSFDEVKAHINSLPEKFRETNALTIKIHNFSHPPEAGSYSKLGSELRLYKPEGRTKSEILDTFTHELSHSLDSERSPNYKYSVKKAYEKIFKADNKLYTYIRPNGKKRTPKKFPTEYAGESWLKFKKSKEKVMKELVFVEDFAESSKLYLNPAKHGQFVKDFPNRAKYLEGIYGKPQWDKSSPLYKALKREGKLPVKSGKETTSSKTVTKTSTKPTVYQLNNRENSYSNVIIGEKHLKPIIDYQKKRVKNKIEYGNCMFLDDATMYHQKDVKGTKDKVKCRRPQIRRDFAFIHNHPGNSNATFSGADMRNQLEYNNQKVTIATTSDGIWIARDTEWATYCKTEGNITSDSISHLMYGMNSKVNEFAKPIYEEKYKSLLENTTDKKEFNKIKEEYRKEYIAQYNDWVLETYGVGKNKYNYFEIEFIPNEELDNVKF